MYKLVSSIIIKQKEESFQKVWSPASWVNTSRWPLKAAWCRAVRPALSDTFTLLSWGTRASAQRTALFAAAMWSGVCQFLSLAFTSAECFSNTWTASCKNVQMHLEIMNPSLWSCELPRNRVVYAYLAAGGHSPVQRSEPLVIFGIYSGTYNQMTLKLLEKRQK